MYFSAEELVVCLLKRTALSISIFVCVRSFFPLSLTRIHTCTLSCHMSTLVERIGPQRVWFCDVC